jgi:cysteine-rich repeat protein
VLAFENPAATAVSVRFDLWNSALGVGVPCGTTIDTALVIRNAAAGVLAQSDDRSGSTDRCSGLIEGVEQCDDGNTLNGDGCSANCQLEGPIASPISRPISHPISHPIARE